MYERFTDRARKVMQLANQEAQRFNHEYIGTEHILLGLVKEGSGVAANVLKNLDVDLRKIRLEVEKLVQSGPDMVTMGKLPQTPRAKKVIEYALEEARELLLDRGSRPALSAHPLRQAIDRLLGGPLAAELLCGTLQGKSTITAHVQDDGGEQRIVFESSEPPRHIDSPRLRRITSVRPHVGLRAGSHEDEGRRSMAEFHTVAWVGEIPDGEGKVVKVNDKLIALFYCDGQYYAIDDVCPHMGASLAGGYVEDKVVTCPWHAWRFRLTDGAWADSPRIKIGCYPVRVVGDEIQVEA